MKLTLIVFFAFVLSSCSTWEEDDEVTMPFPVDSISVKNISGKSISFIAFNDCGSMCWKRTYFESRKNNNEIYVKTFCVSDRGTVCPEVCVDIETPVKINLPSNGTYIFHFWQNDSVNLDTTIVIN